MAKAIRRRGRPVLFGEKMVSVLVPLPKNTLQKLTDRAKKQDVSIPSLIRKALGLSR